MEPVEKGPAWRWIGPALYVLWTAGAIGLAIAKAGLTAESVTRLLVVAFLLVELALRPVLVKALPSLASRLRFVVLATLLAAVVEGCHMISKPLFASLRVGRDATFAQALGRYAVDLAFTVPAYLLIFAVMFAFVRRFRYPTWSYVLGMGLAQTLGDGGIALFSGNPGLLLFLPYPMTNYHAMNVIPFLAVRGEIAPARPAGARAFLAIPAVVATYFLAGGTIKLVGKALGFGA